MKRTISCIIFLAIGLSLFAFDFTTVGLTENGTKDVDGRTFTVLTDPTGRQILFQAIEEPSAERMTALRDLTASLPSWSGLEIAEIRAMNFGDRLEIQVIPAHFSYGGVDLSAAAPGGLRFLYAGSLTYDFNVMSGQFVVRVRGLYTGEGDLGAATESAFKDPGTYLVSKDPVALLKRISDLEARVDKAEADLKAAQDRVAGDEVALMAALNGGKAVNPKAVAFIADQRGADPSFDKKAAAAGLKSAGITASSKEIDVVFLVLFGER